MQVLFPGREGLRVLWGPHGLHQLSGAVITPLFRHYGMSSWHGTDGAIITAFKPGHVLSNVGALGFVRLCALVSVLAAMCAVCCRSTSRCRT
jgi:hypothetical protein